jgi:CheY-like chemotaxis protein
VQVSQAAAPAAARQPRVIGLASGQPRYRILVTDDRTESRQLLTRLLTPLGFEVREADNGEAALAVWEEWSPHLIWMDMRMPIMDGREATKWIKATEKGKATIIIALTASGFDEQREEILADGCDDFMRKPFRESELLDMMHKHLGVQFIYEGSADATATQPDNAPIAPPPTGLPAELREQLQRAVKELNVDAVETVIDQIREYDEALANTLAQMAYRYEYDKIRDWVEGNATM